MEGSRFDHLTRSFSRESRRAVISGGLAGTLAVLLGQTPDVSAVKGVKCSSRKPCTGGKVCKRRRCTKCLSDDECGGGKVCNRRHGVCTACKSGRTGCEGSCLNLSVCPEDEQHVYCNEAKTCICTRIADNNNTAFCAIPDTCAIPCGPDNVCPGNRTCVMTCCDGKDNAGLRCLNPCES